MKSKPAQPLGVVPPQGDAYRSLRPLLLSALGELARRGYVAVPGDGLELIHDFFVEAWPGIAARFDARHGSLSTYVFAAFVRFARPRIVRLARWQDGLLPPDALDLPSARATLVDPPHDAPADLAAVGDALATLSDGDRQLLAARVGRGESERVVAGRLGVSRYRLRESCAEALARLAAALDEPGVIERVDWPLARALWGDGRSLADAAAAVGLTLHQARDARHRILQTLARSISSGDTTAHPPRRTPMSQDLCTLWRELSAHPTDAAVAARARARLEELLDHVEDCARCAEGGESPRDVAALYLALGAGEEALDPADAEVLESLLAADAADEAQVAAAVEEALLPGLSARARALHCRLPAEVTPRAVFLATEALAMLLRRFARSNKLLRKRFLLGATGAVELDGVELIPATTVAAEIARLAHVSRDAAAELAAFLPIAARSQPGLLRGLAAAPARRSSDAVELTFLDGDAADEEDLFRRWRPPAASAEPPLDVAAALRSPSPRQRPTPVVVSQKRPIKSRGKRAATGDRAAPKSEPGGPSGSPPGVPGRGRRGR